jgi:hypothetical protein
MMFPLTLRCTDALLHGTVLERRQADNGRLGQRSGWGNPSKPELVVTAKEQRVSRGTAAG